MKRRTVIIVYLIEVLLAPCIGLYFHLNPYEIGLIAVLLILITMALAAVKKGKGNCGGNCHNCSGCKYKDE